jgi:hypothetical protein
MPFPDIIITNTPDSKQYNCNCKKNKSESNISKIYNIQNDFINTNYEQLQKLGKTNSK